MSRHSGTRRDLGVAVSALLMLNLITGCGGLNTEIRYRSPVSVDSAFVRTVEGVTLRIDPLTDPSRARDIFERTPATMGILAIHLTVENYGLTSLLLQKSNMQFGSDDVGGEFKADHGGEIGERRYSSGERTASAIVGFALGGGGIAEHDVRANHNFAREELRDTVLRPGQKAQGCVYFRVPKGADSHHGRLNITLIDMQTRTPFTAKFEISGQVQ